MKNIAELRDVMCSTIAQLQGGYIPPEVAKQISLLAARALSSVAEELAYASAKGEKPNIAFMETGQRSLEE